MEYIQQVLSGMGSFINRNPVPQEKKRIIAPIESRYIPSQKDIDAKPNSVIVGETPAKLSIDRNSFRNKRRSGIRNPEVLQPNYKAAVLEEIQDNLSQSTSSFSEPASSLKIKRQPKSVNRISLQAPSNSAIPVPLEIPIEQYEQTELNFGNGVQDLSSNSGNGRISLNNKNNNIANKKKILAPIYTPVSEAIAKNIETLSNEPVANFSQSKRNIRTVDRSASGQKRIVSAPETKTQILETNNGYSNRDVSAVKPNYVAYSDGRIDDMSRVNVPAPINDPYEKIRIQKEAEANAAKFNADFVSGGDGVYRASNTGNAIVPIGEVVDTTAEDIKPKTNIKALQTTIASNGTTTVNMNQDIKLHTMGNMPKLGPELYNTKAISSLQMMNQEAKIGKRLEENFTNPKPSSLKKYGAYALGALAATALVNAMFFGDNKGEQSNAQLYGQQPLY